MICTHEKTSLKHHARCGCRPQTDRLRETDEDSSRQAGVVAYDIIKNNRITQITNNQKDKNWNSGDSWNSKGQKPVTPQKPDSRQQITANNYQEAIRLSGQHGMPVFAYFEADWCTWCKKMKRDTLADAKVKEIMKNYIVVFVDTDKNRAVANKFGVQYLPAYSITNVNEINLKSGEKYQDANAFASWLDNPSMYKQPKTSVSPPVKPPEVKPPDDDSRKPWFPRRPRNPSFSPGGG